jgi:tRNA (cmo5U34)-methyltransferase
MPEDRIFSLPLSKVGDFVFDEKVVEVFPDMISRSVPGYASIVGMTVELAAKYAMPQTYVYDLGCSLGAVTLPMSRRVPDSCHIVGVDSSPAMVESLLQKLEQESKAGAVDIVQEDIRAMDFEPSSFMVMNYTLQFIPREDRLEVLSRIGQSLQPGGALVLSEKVNVGNSEAQKMLTDLHHSFKRANGYSDLEIAQKRTSLENTLIPESVETHLERLEAAGFRSALVWFQCLNFASFLAVK